MATRWSPEKVWKIILYRQFFKSFLRFSTRPRHQGDHRVAIARDMWWRVQQLLRTGPFIAILLMNSCGVMSPNEDIVQNISAPSDSNPQKETFDSNPSSQNTKPTSSQANDLIEATKTISQNTITAHPAKVDLPTYPNIPDSVKKFSYYQQLSHDLKSQINHSYAQQLKSKSLHGFLGPLNPTATPKSEDQCPKYQTFLCFDQPKNLTRFDQAFVNFKLFIHLKDLYEADPDDPILEINIVNLTTNELLNPVPILFKWDHLKTFNENNAFAYIEGQLPLVPYGHFAIVAGAYQKVGLGQVEYQSLAVEVYKTQDPQVSLVPNKIYPIVRNLKLPPVNLNTSNSLTGKAGLIDADDEKNDTLILAADAVELTYRLNTAFSPSVQVKFAAEHHGVRKFFNNSILGNNSSQPAQCEAGVCQFTARIPLGDGMNTLKVSASDPEAEEFSENLAKEIKIYNFQKPHIKWIQPDFKNDIISQNILEQIDSFQFCYTAVPEVTSMNPPNHDLECISNLQNLSTQLFVNGEEALLDFDQATGVFSTQNFPDTFFGFNFLEVNTQRQVQYLEDLNQDSMDDQPHAWGPPKKLIDRPRPPSSPGIQKPQKGSGIFPYLTQETQISYSKTHRFLRGSPKYFFRDQQIFPENSMIESGIHLELNSSIIKNQFSQLFFKFLNHQKAIDQLMISFFNDKEARAKESCPEAGPDATVGIGWRLDVNPQTLSLSELKLNSLQLIEGAIFSSVTFKRFKVDGLLYNLGDHPEFHGLRVDWDECPISFEDFKVPEDFLICPPIGGIPIDVRTKEYTLNFQIKIDSNELVRFNIIKSEPFIFSHAVGNCPYGRYYCVDTERFPHGSQEDTVAESAEHTGYFNYVLDEMIDADILCDLEYRFNQHIKNIYPNFDRFFSSDLLSHLFTQSPTRFEWLGNHYSFNQSYDLSRAKWSVHPEGIFTKVPYRFLPNDSSLEKLLTGSFFGNFFWLARNQEEELVDIMKTNQELPLGISLSEETLNQILGSFLASKAFDFYLEPKFYHQKDAFPWSPLAPFPETFVQTSQHPLAPDFDFNLDGRIDPFEFAEYAVALQIKPSKSTPPTIALLSLNEKQSLAKLESKTDSFDPEKPFYDSDHQYIRFGTDLEIVAFKQALEASDFRRYCKQYQPWSDPFLNDKNLCSQGTFGQYEWDGLKQSQLPHEFLQKQTSSRESVLKIDQIKTDSFEESCLKQGGEIVFLPKNNGPKLSHSLNQENIPLYKVKINFGTIAKIMDLYQRTPFDPKMAGPDFSQGTKSFIHFQLPLIKNSKPNHGLFFEIDVLENNSNQPDVVIKSVFENVMMELFGKPCNGFNEWTLPIPNRIDFNEDREAFLNDLGVFGIDLGEMSNQAPTVSIDEQGQYIHFVFPFDLIKTPD